LADQKKTNDTFRSSKILCGYSVNLSVANYFGLLGKKDQTKGINKKDPGWPTEHNFDY